LPSYQNSIHWVLDLAFREDESCMRQGHAEENRSGTERHTYKKA